MLPEDDRVIEICRSVLNDLMQILDFLNNMCMCVCLCVCVCVRAPIPVAARPNAWVYGHSLAGIVGSNPAGGMDVGLCWVLCVVR